MSLSLTLEGTDVVVAHLHAIGERVKPVAARALLAEAEAIMTRSKEEYVPVDTGVLRASGHVNPPDIHGDDVSVSLGFGGAAKDYAVIQHERLDYKHTVGGPKYLERPLLEATRGLAERIGKVIKEAFT